MKDRIRAIMENENLTPSAFADKLQLGRAVVSHILNGRNNPSLDVVTRILSKIDYITPDWLITGNGEMCKSGYTSQNAASTQFTNQQIFDPNKIEPDLFSQSSISRSSDQNNSEYRKEIRVEQPVVDTNDIVNQHIIYQKAPDRKISKIIIYYTDNTFETFDANNRPL